MAEIEILFDYLFRIVWNIFLGGRGVLGFFMIKNKFTFLLFNLYLFAGYPQNQGVSP